jgi:hypothetical protein
MTPQQRFAELVEFYAQKKFEKMVNKATQLSLEYPSSFEVWNILAAAQKALGHLSEAETSPMSQHGKDLFMLPS